MVIEIINPNELTNKTQFNSGEVVTIADKRYLCVGENAIYLNLFEIGGGGMYCGVNTNNQYK